MDDAVQRFRRLVERELGDQQPAPKAKSRQLLNSVAEGSLQVPAIERLAAPFWRSVDVRGI